MGNNSGRPIAEEMDERFLIVKRFEDPSITLREGRKDRSECLVRELVMFKEDEHKRQIDRLQEKKLVEDPHVVRLVDYASNVEDMFCSTHHKIYVVYAYPHRNLDQQISERVFQKRRFQEREIWSILASCILGLATLQKHHIKHQGLQSETVLLSSSGVIQVADPYCTAAQTNYQRMLHSRQNKNIYLSPELCELLAKEEVVVPESIDPYKSDVFALGMIALEMALLQYQYECYRQDFTRVHWETIEYRIEQVGRLYSQELKVMIELMLQRDPANRQLWSEMQTYVKKSEPVFVESQIVQEPPGISNPSKTSSSVDASPATKKFERPPSIKLQPPSVRLQPAQSSTKTQEAESDRILPVQVSSAVRPRLILGINDNYVTRAQFDQNLMEVSDDQTNERESTSIPISSGKVLDPVQTLQKKPSEASIRQNSLQSGIRPISHKGSTESFNQQPAADFHAPININPKSFTKTHSSKSGVGVSEDASAGAAVMVPALDSKYYVPNYASSTYEPLKTYSHYEPIATSILDPIKPSYAMPPIHSSSFSPTFNYPPITSSYYTSTSAVDWMSRPVGAYPATDYKDLFTDYSKLGIQKQNTYIPSVYTMPVKPDYSAASSLDLGLTQTKKYAEYSREVQPVQSKPVQSVITHSPIKIMNNSTTSPFNMAKESSSVEISSKRPEEVVSKPVHMPTEPSSRPISQHSQQPTPLAMHHRSQSVSKFTQVPKEGSSTPIYVIDNFKYGARYEGEKINNLRHGKGKFFYQDGGLYDGDWVRNKMEGSGKLYYKSGKIAYEGEWKDDEFCGEGILYNEFPEPMKAPFDPRDFDNMDECWTKFEGMFSKDMKEGKGTLYFTNGDYFTGTFNRDFVNGPGIFHSGSRALRGVWASNKLVSELGSQ